MRQVDICCQLANHSLPAAPQCFRSRCTGSWYTTSTFVAFAIMRTGLISHSRSVAIKQDSSQYIQPQTDAWSCILAWSLHKAWCLLSLCQILTYLLSNVADSPVHCKCLLQTKAGRQRECFPWSIWLRYWHGKHQTSLFWTFQAASPVILENFRFCQACQIFNTWGYMVTKQHISNFSAL